MYTHTHTHNIQGAIGGYIHITGSWKRMFIGWAVVLHKVNNAEERDKCASEREGQCCIPAV